MKKEVERNHDAKNKRYKTHLPLDYSKLKPKDFVSKNPWAKHIDTYPVRFANFIFFTLKAAVIKMEHSRTPEALLYMQNTIRSIPRHKMDHPGASCAQRKRYHAYCRPDFCEFAALPTEELKLAYTTNIVGEFWYEEKTKKGRPSTKAMDQILAKFDEFSTIAVMNRLTRWLNQNCNESIHHRLFRIISKSKSFKYEHILFAALMAAVIHNVGYEGAIGSLYRQMGTYYREEQKVLRWRDDGRRKSGEEKHQKKKKISRFADSTPLVDGGLPNYAPGFAFEDEHIDGVVQFEERQDAIARDAQNLNDDDVDIDQAEQDPDRINEVLNLDNET